MRSPTNLFFIRVTEHDSDACGFSDDGAYEDLKDAEEEGRRVLERHFKTITNDILCRDEGYPEFFYDVEGAQYEIDEFTKSARNWLNVDLFASIEIVELNDSMGWNREWLIAQIAFMRREGFFSGLTFGHEAT